jgi:hypothetical protein
MSTPYRKEFPMKRTLLGLPLIVMILASIACSLITVGIEEEPTISNATPTPLADQLTPEAPATPTALVPEGGFITGALLDTATLPHGQRVGQDGPGMMGVQCIGDNTKPSIGLRYGTLCLNNFPTAPDSPGFTVTLVDPTGRSFSETFTYNQDEIVNSRGIQVGRAQDRDDIESLLAEGLTANMGVYMELYMPANLPSGDWLVSANTQDGSINVEPTTITLSGDDYMHANVLVDLSTNPFINHPKVFTNNETIYLVGQGYPPNTAITIAFYQADPSTTTLQGMPEFYTAKYATSVTIDNTGSFQTQFIVGSTTLRGSYCGFVEQFAGQVTTSTNASGNTWLTCNDAATDTFFSIE